MNHIYAAIGRAVIAAQLFEIVLVPTFQIFKMIGDAAYQEKTGGCIPAGSFKMAIKNIIKGLAEKGEIAADLEERLNNYIEDRHTLVHRWVQEYGWPDETNPDVFGEVVALAARVEAESINLARIFSGYIVKYADPDWAAENMNEYRSRMAEIFRKAHLDE